jgi:hypothetical protein
MMSPPLLPIKPGLAVVAVLLLSACSGPTVRQAIGTGAEATPIVLHTSASALTVENHAGRPLLNVRVTIEAAGTPLPFVRIIPMMGAGQTMTLSLTDFQTEEGVALDPLAAPPTQATVKARDTLTNSYDVTTRWP